MQQQKPLFTPPKPTLSRGFMPLRPSYITLQLEMPFTIYGGEIEPKTDTSTSTTGVRQGFGGNLQLTYEF